eukprot:1072107-Pelagomonas_calceolata.AAC.3
MTHTPKQAHPGQSKDNRVRNSGTDFLPKQRSKITRTTLVQEQLKKEEKLKCENNNNNKYESKGTFDHQFRALMVAAVSWPALKCMSKCTSDRWYKALMVASVSWPTLKYTSIA